jgi:2-keto-4-pentenoate hydratase/2-oxohepta-3-ene-1,7-dioic acid hydratase in catechol pathway
MRFVRFRWGKRIHHGLWEEEGIRPIQGRPPGKWKPTHDILCAEAVQLLAPCTPSKVVALGLNYRDHAQETQMALPPEPLLFLKPSTSVIGPGESIRIPAMSGRVDYEAEMGVVIGKPAKDVPVERAEEFIWGYTCLNDVTARDLQGQDGQWTRAKGFDSFCPIGPWVVSGIDASDLAIEGLLNGEVKQRSSTRQLVFSVPYLVSFISRVMTLLPGDVIATGTPSGIGPMKPGDRFLVRIEGIGTLENPVI